MSTWLFDLGNTRLKVAQLHGDGSLGEVAAIAHQEGDAWLQALPTGQVACIASVASDERRTALVDALCARFVRLHRVRTERALGPLRIAYDNPAHLGVDRFLAMLGVCGEAPALVVGVGTALTIDLVDGEGRHHGGRIAPSPSLMREALHARASQLPLEGGRYMAFGDDTVHALASGCEGAALALVAQSLDAAQALLGMRPMPCLHGGGAGALRPHVGGHAWVPDAVLRGLACWHALRIA